MSLRRKPSRELSPMARTTPGCASQRQYGTNPVIRNCSRRNKPRLTSTPARRPRAATEGSCCPCSITHLPATHHRQAWTSTHQPNILELNVHAVISLLQPLKLAHGVHSSAFAPLADLPLWALRRAALRHQLHRPPKVHSLFLSFLPSACQCPASSHHVPTVVHVSSPKRTHTAVLGYLVSSGPRCSDQFPWCFHSYCFAIHVPSTQAHTYL